MKNIDKNIILNWLEERWRGVGIVLLIALAAQFLAEHYHAPVMLFALLLGMAMNFLVDNSPTRIGIEFSASTLLRTGVALLGLRITFEQLSSIGWTPIFLVITAVAFTIIFSILLAKMMNLHLLLGLLTGGATAICGASAALAIAAVLPPHPSKNKATLLTVIMVSCLSTLAMIIYPLLVKYFALSPIDAGIFLGATIHDVAQVVGAGYAVSQLTGDYAMIIKMLRVSLLIPVVMLAMLLGKKLMPTVTTHADKKSLPPPPWFLLLFIVLMFLNSLKLIPSLLVTAGQSLSAWLLTFAMVAIGMKTQLREIFTVGYRPILLIFLETFILAAIVLIALSFK